MPELRNSRRSFLHATYTPIDTPQDERELLRGAEKRAFLLQLRPDQDELEAFEKSATLWREHSSALRGVLAADGLDVVDEVRPASSIPASAILALGERLSTSRSGTLDSASSPADRTPTASLGIGGVPGTHRHRADRVLHLEKLCFTPMDAARGELIYSVPLAPDAEANIAHREWSNTSQEFERLATDVLEEFSEEGSARRTSFNKRRKISTSAC